MTDRSMDRTEWGRYGQEPPCEHLIKLRDTLRENGLRVWGELTTGGWVNIHCQECGRTYEDVLDDNRSMDEDTYGRWT